MLLVLPVLVALLALVVTVYLQALLVLLLQEPVVVAEHMMHEVVAQVARAVLAVERLALDKRLRQTPQ